MPGIIVLSTRPFAWALTLIVAGLALASLLSQLGKPILLGHGLWKVQQLFDLDGELNVSTWYAASSLLVCAALLALIASVKRRAGDPYASHWAGLAVLFVLLSVDEAVSIHESTIRPLRSLLGTGGILHYAWVIPAGFGVLVLLALYARFLRDLPRPFGRLFVLAGVVFCAGALGMEMVEGYLVEVHGKDSLARLIPTTLEETLEMAGVAIFLCALVSYIGQKVGPITLQFGTLPHAAAHPAASAPAFAAHERVPGVPLMLRRDSGRHLTPAG